jgi:hypothetical protein
MLLLLATVTTSFDASARPDIQATASVRVQRSRPVNEYEWKHTPKLSRRETVVQDDQGRLLLLRLVEYQ